MGVFRVQFFVPAPSYFRQFKTIIASTGLNFWVRNEIRCNTRDKAPEQKIQLCEKF